MAQAQVVHTESGDVRGVSNGAITSFKGVPFGAPPVGDARWRAPRPAIPWAGIRDASTYGSDCAQLPSPPPRNATIRTTPSEDCLYLNIWRPKTVTAGAKLPVMVWIFGGAGILGGSSPAIYSGESFARDGVILLSFNYRVGNFGFFAHPALEREGFGGNYGFLDQVAVLRWVQRNIAAFGGDPQRVTIFGYSAGGYSVWSLLQSPAARGLFAGAIVESGGGRTDVIPMPTIAQAAAVGESIAPGLSAAELRRLPTERILVGRDTLTAVETPKFAGPMVDDQTLFGSALDAVRAGLIADVPIMIGGNSADGFPMVPDKERMFGAFGSHASEARAIYDPAGTGSPFTLAIATNADRIFLEPARSAARALADRHRKVWLYRFAWANPIYADASKISPAWSGSWGGAAHGSEVPFVFDNLAARELGNIVPREQAVAMLTHRYWVNFAKTGRPDGLPGVPAWPAVRSQDDEVQIIDGEGARHARDPYKSRLDVTEKIAR